MRIVFYRYLDPSGQSHSGIGVAAGIGNLKQRLLAKNRILLSAKTFPGKGTLSTAGREMLYRELASLASAGVSLGEALRLLAAENQLLAPWCTRWAQGLEAGKSLSQMAAASPEASSPLVVKMLQVGETTGDMSGSLTRIAEHLAALNRLRHKIVSALTYPAIVLGVSVIAVVVLTVYVIPMFLDMFRRYQVELPGITQALLGITGFLADFGWVLAGVMLVLWFLGRHRGWRQSPRFHRILGSIPWLGSTLGLHQNLVIMRNLANLLAADVRIHDSVAILYGLSRNPEYNRRIREVGIRINKGDALSVALRSGGLLPERDLVLIRIGEETGQLVAQTAHLASDYEQRLDRRFTRFLALFEPVLIVTLSGVIGFILIALYLPLFDMLGGGALSR